MRKPSASGWCLVELNTTRGHRLELPIVAYQPRRPPCAIPQPVTTTHCQSLSQPRYRAWHCVSISSEPPRRLLDFEGFMGVASPQAQGFTKLPSVKRRPNRAGLLWLAGRDKVFISLLIDSSRLVGRISGPHMPPEVGNVFW